MYRNVSLQAVDYSALLQDEDNLDPSPSEPLEIVLPKDQDGKYKELCIVWSDHLKQSRMYNYVLNLYVP